MKADLLIALLFYHLPARSGEQKCIAGNAHGKGMHRSAWKTKLYIMEKETEHVLNAHASKL